MLGRYVISICNYITCRYIIIKKNHVDWTRTFLQNVALRVVFFTFFSAISPGAFGKKFDFRFDAPTWPNAKHDQNKYVPDRGELTVRGRTRGRKIIIFFKYLRFTTLTVRAQLRGDVKRAYDDRAK